MSNRVDKIKELEELIMRGCLQRFYDGWEDTPKYLREEYIAAMTMIGIGIMHGSMGEEFVGGFLDRAKESLRDSANVFVFKDKQRH